MTNYRAVLEVLKYLDTQDILRHTSSTCKSWKKASETEELWAELMERDIGEVSGATKKTYENEIIRYRLVVLTDTHLHLFNCKNQSWNIRPLSSQVYKAEDASMVFLPLGRLLCCGGFRRREAFLIQLNGQVAPISELVTPRYRPGIAAVQDHVYVFGGVNQCGLRSCEQFVLSSDLKSQIWTLLPDMHYVRHSFNPCVLGNRIYLYGGHTNTAEVFDHLTQIFQKISTPDFLGEQCAVLDGDSIVVVSELKISYVNVEDLRTQSEDHNRWDGLYSLEPPVMYQGVVFTVWRGAVQTINLATLKTSKMSRPIR